MSGLFIGAIFLLGVAADPQTARDVHFALVCLIALAVAAVVLWWKRNRMG
jgi:membrane protein DedA with SNARE-associated domain